MRPPQSSTGRIHSKTGAAILQTLGAAAHGRGAWPLVFLLGLSLRVATSTFLPHEIDNDEAAYINLATEWAETGRFARQGVPETHIAPLLPALHAALIVRAGHPEGVGIGLALLLSALVPVVTGRLFEALAGRYCGVVVGVVLCGYPPLLVSATQIQPEGLMAVLWGIFLLACLRERLVLAGIALGLAYLTRPEAILLLPPWLLFEWLRQRRPPMRVLLAATACLSLAVPYIVHQSRAEQRFCLSGKDIWVYANGIAQVQTGNRPVEWAHLDRIRAEIESVPRHIAQDPLRFARDYFIRCAYELRNLLRQTYFIGLVLAVAGWIAIRRRHPEGAAYLLIPLGVVGLIPIGMTAYRHTLPILPLLIGLAVAAGCRNVKRSRRLPPTL